jgi:uncharacterized coiled-coil protein SlyX
MTPEQFIELEMRLSALEYVVCKLNVAILAATVPLDQIPARLDQFAEEAGQQLFPGLDPALSDHASAEWQAAIGKLVKAQKEMLAGTRKRTGI